MRLSQCRKKEIKARGKSAVDRDSLQEKSKRQINPNVNIPEMERTVYSRSVQTVEANYQFVMVRGPVIGSQVQKQIRSRSGGPRSKLMMNR